MDDFPSILDTIHANSSPPDPVTGCRLWQKAVSANKYGVTKSPFDKKKTDYVHRIAYMASHGVTFLRENKFDVSHLCHNKLCVEPSHLTYEPHSQNQERIHCFHQKICSKGHKPFCIIKPNMN